MIVRDFTCERHDDFGEKGWKPDWMQGGDPYGGMAVAHDTLEHFPDERRYSPAEGEFMASGAIYFLRGETDWWSRTGNVVAPVDHIASDYISLIVPQRLRGEHAQHFGAAPRCDRPQYPDVWRFFRFGVMDRIAKGLAEEHESDPESDDDVYTLRPWERIAMAGWMYHGYVKARRRYRQCDNYSLSYLFTQIMEEADKQLGWAEEGYRLHLAVNLRRCSYSMRVEIPEEY